MPTATLSVAVMVDKRACPPEDCGGAWRYPDLLAVLADPEHEDHLEVKAWVEFDPEHFDPAEVVFRDPIERYRECFN